MTAEGKKPTCGPLFYEAMKLALMSTENAEELFSYGHIVGQAEKVWLGACPAAMFRPTEHEEANFISRLTGICNIYKLDSITLHTSRGHEYWMFRGESRSDIELLREKKEDTGAWHQLRGLLCGVRSQDIDFIFHERYE